MVRTLSRFEFAQHLGYRDWDELMSVSRPVVEEGEIATWYVTLMPDGIRWAAWDTAELAADRVEKFDSLKDAVQHQYDAFLAAVAEGRLSPEDWVGPDPATFGAPVRVYPLARYEAEGGKYDDSGNGGGPVDPEDFVYAVVADDIDDIVGVLGGSRKDYWNDSVTGFWLRYRD